MKIPENSFRGGSAGLAQQPGGTEQMANARPGAGATQNAQERDRKEPRPRKGGRGETHRDAQRRRMARLTAVIAESACH